MRRGRRENREKEKERERERDARIGIYLIDILAERFIANLFSPNAKINYLLTLTQSRRETVEKDGRCLRSADRIVELFSPECETTCHEWISNEHRIRGSCESRWEISWETSSLRSTKTNSLYASSLSLSLSHSFSSSVRFLRTSHHPSRSLCVAAAYLAYFFDFERRRANKLRDPPAAGEKEQNARFNPF